MNRVQQHPSSGEVRASLVEEDQANCHTAILPLDWRTLAALVSVSLNVAGWPYDVQLNKKVTCAADGKYDAATSPEIRAPTFA